MTENIRPAGQGDMDSYVPGRLPYLEKWVKEHAEPAAPFETRPATRAVCQRCHARLPFAASPEEEQRELVEHLGRCWGPTEEPPVGAADGREHRPNIWGEVAAEADTACMVFAVQAPGPAGGAYLLVTALPTHLATLTALDHQLRELWYQDRDPCPRRNHMSPDDKAHLSMFLARLPSTLPRPAAMDRAELKKELQERELSARGSKEELEERVKEARREGGEGEVEEGVEERLYRGYLPNQAAVELEGLGQGCTAGYWQAGRVMVVREWGGIYWPAVCMPETATGLVGRADGPRGRWGSYQGNSLWHAVFIHRGNRRIWARSDRDNMWVYFPWRQPEAGLTLETEEEIAEVKEKCLRLPGGKAATQFRDAEEEARWLEAMREAVNMFYMKSDQEVLTRCAELGMTGAGELVEQISYGEQCRLAPWGSQEREEARPTWSFLKSWEEGGMSHMPTPLPVTKEKVSAADD